MKAVILSNGRIDDYQYIKNKISRADTLICADGGGFHAGEMRLIPNVLIGDFDSLDEKTIRIFESKGTKIFKYEREKDQTDTQLAVEYAVEKGADEVILLGCTGSRFDHSYANVSLLVWLMQKGIKGTLIDEYNEICVIDRYIKLSGNEGDLVSLLAVTPKVSGVTTKGLRYSLEDGELRNNNTLGISNEFISKEAEIWIKEGILMVVRAKN